MAGCKSCSSCRTEPNYQPPSRVEKLVKGERSGNPRYPHILVGNEAIYSDDTAQLIVTVESDDCNEDCDCFTLKPQRILKDTSEGYTSQEAFQVTQTAGEKLWRLHALF